MEAAESFDQLRCVEACPSLTELLIFTQMVEQLATVEEIHDEVELGRCLESVVQLDNEWTVNLFQDISFSYNNCKKSCYY